MATTDKKIVNVAVAVIQFEQRVFIAKRRADQHQGNRWEFPGGKIEQDETTAVALIRELQEETGVDIGQEQVEPLLDIPFEYPEKSVFLRVCKVNLNAQQAIQIHGAEGQEARWVDIDELDQYQFPEANTAILAAL